jgi:nucleotide-binding universal stress UspA family protein
VHSILAMQQIKEKRAMKIMVAYDDTPEAWDALEFAQRHARGFEATVVVVHSLRGSSDEPAEDYARAEKRLANATDALDAAGIPCESHLLVRGMEPGEDLVQFAREQNVAEIVLGVKKRSRLGKLVFGSTAQFVILEAPCPVVSVK